MTNEIVVVKQGRGKPAKVERIMNAKQLLQPYLDGKTFRDAHGRSMTKEEGMLYLTEKFKNVGSIGRDWDGEARYCGVGRTSMYEWRKDFFKRVKIDQVEIRVELDNHLRQAINQAAMAMNTPLPPPGPDGKIDPMGRAITVKLRLDAIRALAQATQAYTNFAEKWGLKERDFGPTEVLEVQAESITSSAQEAIVDRVLKEFDDDLQAKSKKPEGV